jgi:squalene-hopene/tetraprenyl-beta-curcumene cyclase
MSDPSAAIPAPDDAEFSRALDETIELAGAELGAGQAGDGHWSYQLEADATIPAEYIILNHFLDEIDDPTEQKLARYLRRIQGPDGGWPLFAAGEANISASVKAYLAL